MSVETVEHDDEKLERLTLWIWTYWGTRVNLALWEDKTMWIEVAALPAGTQKKYAEGFYRSADSLTFAELIQALVDTVSISTRLGFFESTEPILRKLWRYTGDFEFTGKLGDRG